MALFYLGTFEMKYILFLVSFSLLTACAETNVLTKKEMAMQNKADAVVSAVLFDHDMSETASYNVRKNGSVAIKFKESVSEKNYTKVVKLLRAIKAIGGVDAEQGGNEVCGLR